ncbi:hypothetical protein HF086_017503 [Spodoptera exigua]|uniref:receptor protein serine/threonine kinase n=1 Tax=Spodoptera exigua TaxID=7107 RepID=A0A922SAI8_SPOEX|nr:hypothetical protein HF086_017503 [Spodoptera exigua]
MFTAGLPGLDEDEVSGSTQEPESQHIDDPITIEKMMVQQPSLRKRHAGLHNISCCQGDLCNAGTFPELAPLADTAIEPLPSNAWKLWASVAASVLVVTIAHRDIKTKNILVKVNGECCIADLGLAVTRAHLTAGLHHNPRQGTKRYMSPEMLDQSMNVLSLESHQQCDVYSAALVLWEVAGRTRPAPRDYRVPYYDLAPADPSFDDMRKITMVGMAQLMRECWHQNPSVRLPALRIKKTLLKLAAADNSIRLNEDNEVSV